MIATPDASQSAKIHAVTASNIDDVFGCRVTLIRFSLIKKNVTNMKIIVNKVAGIDVSLSPSDILQKVI